MERSATSKPVFWLGGSLDSGAGSGDGFLVQGVRSELVERKTPEVRPKQAEILWRCQCARRWKPCTPCTPYSLSRRLLGRGAGKGRQG